MYQPPEPEASHPLNDKNLGAFSDLATEVIVQILSNVSWKDLLSIRQACKFFEGVSRTRSLWENLVEQYSTPTENSPRSLRLELPMSMYTSAEFEQQITRWKRSQLAWRQGKVYKRHTITEDFWANTIHLVKGGRWLLRHLTDHGSVVCHDLDNRHIEPVTLIPAVHPRAEWSNSIMAVEEIDDAPCLIIRLALVYTVAEGDSQRRTDIWSSHLIADGPQQTDAVFTLKLCSSFTLPANFTSVYLVSLLGECIAFKFTCASTDLSFLAVVNWVNGEWKNNEYPRQYISSIQHHEPLHFSLLARNRMFVVLNDAQLVLWSFEGSKETTDAPNPDSPDGQLLWSHNAQSGQCYQMSGPFVCTDSTRLIISFHSSISGVIIPNDHPEQTTIFKLMDITADPRFLIQHSYCWTARVGPGLASAITFRWPDEHGDALVTPISAGHEFCPADLSDQVYLSSWEAFRMLFDESSGRIVTELTLTRTIDIWEAHTT
ncbi:hypothetical protein D9619_009622 [Psilocybe cf. subviscida]|uniref:F-box domain-containing protein n=1 Tax=Psilocybe cf. subviscida TaxID=2480587 RepID=A0A8H5F639_9AGAR|nr:hypothetical protein D9619_009622 [Psilocybe cf. subviscida]